MRIAIASCANANLNPAQPVWRNIAQKRPDTLILLGDSIYLDIPWVSTRFDGIRHPSDADWKDFLEHGLKLYRGQLAQADFNNLIRTTDRIHAIWDDHDFMWNGATGGALPTNIYGDHLRATRALFKAFREVLQSRRPDQFPQTIDDPRLGNPYEPAPGYQPVDLDAGVCLHLTDGRSYRDKHDLLGSSQRAQISLEMQKRSEHIHLLASGIVFGGMKGERWQGFPDDYQWLQQMAARHKILVMSGDVHENRLPPPFPVPGGKSIYEITSSGAAIGKLVVAGDPLHNFGLIEIEGGQIKLSTYTGAAGTMQGSSPAINVSTWT